MPNSVFNTHTSGYGDHHAREPLLAWQAAAASWSTTAHVVFWLIVALYVVLRMWTLTRYDLWADEVTTLLILRQNWSEVFHYTLQDIVHPPLFYLLPKAWFDLGGGSTQWVRYFPLVASVVGIVPFRAICRELRLGAAQTNLAFLLISVNGLLVYYAQELRVYSLLMTLALCSIWVFLRFFNGAGSRWIWVALFGVNLVLVYSHLFGWLVLGVEWLALVIWQRNRLLAFSLVLVAVAACLAPWLNSIAQAAAQKGGYEQNLGWIMVPTIQDLAWFYVLISGPFRTPFPLGVTLAALVLFGSGPALWLLQSVQLRRTGQPAQQEHSRVLVFLGLFTLLPAMITFVASHLLPQSVWHPRYLIFVIIPYLLLIAISSLAVRPRRLRQLVVAALVAWSLASGIEEIRQTDRIAWHSVVEQIASNEPSRTGGIRVYSLGVHDLDFYFAEAGEQRFVVEKVRDRTQPLHLTDQHAWVAMRVYGDRYSAGFQDTPPEEARVYQELRQNLTSQGYRIDTTIEQGTP
ncbi:MAG TPA: hypothetical protein VFT99_20640, partial [Roseiflexaceae bacterium]|nr:hypothetical protein [Roseiflexaceae bacterium]